MAAPKRAAKVPAQEYEAPEPEPTDEVRADDDVVADEAQSVEAAEPVAAEPTDEVEAPKLQWELGRPAPATVWRNYKTDEITFEKPETAQGIVAEGETVRSYVLTILKRAGIAK
jgi:hypothetical protein